MSALKVVGLLAAAVLAGNLLLMGWLAFGPTVAAWLFPQAGDLYPPEAADAPDSVDEHFTSAPRDVRMAPAEMDRLVEQFDWQRYSTWLREPS